MVAEIAAKQSGVAEFARIREMAERRGLRIFLFGGTAAAYAHYVKWDLEQRRGLRKLQANRFDYEYTRIFRHNQDLDLVVTRADGKPETEEEIAALRDEILATFEYGRGDKTQWELRGLKTSFGNKGALFQSPDFLNQHTDSNSTGLIELTRTKAIEPIIQDLRDGNSNPPQFLKDVLEQKIHFYFSKEHGTTKRAKEGLNPPILSAIRYLTKALQYDLEMDDESRRNVVQIIREWDPRSVPTDSYVARWIEKNAKKLVQNASDLESAWNLLEELGLRKKLISLKQNPGEMYSMAWWMSKEPLRTKTHPSGYAFGNPQPGKTAGELKLEVVTHATKTFEAYEAITRSPSGKPNLFISRPNTEFESASEGAGLYSLSGAVPPSFTQGYAIRFHVDPRAREGVDFRRVGETVIWMTSTYLTVVPDAIKNNVTPIEAFEYFIDPKNFAEEGVKHRIARSVGKIPITREMIEIIHERMREMIRKNDWVALNEATLLPAAKALVPELLREFNLDLFEIQRLKTAPLNHANQIALMRIAYPMTKTPKEFVTLLRLWTAGGDNLGASPMAMQLGVLVNEAADHFLTLSPTVSDFYALRKYTTYFVHHLRGLMRKALPLAKNMSDLREVLEFSVINPSDHYLNEIANFVADNASFIMSLRPTSADLKELREKWMSKNAEAICRFNSLALPMVKNIEEFEALVFGPDQKKSVAMTGAQFEEWIVEHIDKYIELGANIERIKKMESVTVHYARTPSLIWEKSLPLVRNVEDFFRLTSLPWPMPSQEAQLTIDEFLVKHFDLFMSLNPSEQQVVNFKKRLYGTQQALAIEEKLWERSKKTGKDFLSRVRQVHSPGPSANVDAHSKWIASHLDESLLSQMTQYEIKELITETAFWRAMLVSDATDPKMLDYFFGTPEKPSRFIRTKANFEIVVKMLSNPLRNTGNIPAEKRIASLAGHYLSLGAKIEDLKQLERYSFANMESIKALWEEAVKLVRKPADFIELFKGMWPPTAEGYEVDRMGIAKKHIDRFKELMPSWENWNQLRGQFQGSVARYGQMSDEMFGAFPTAKSFVEIATTGWLPRNESDRLYIKQWVSERVEKFLSLSPTRSEVTAFLRHSWSAEPNEFNKNTSISKYVLTHISDWLKEETDPISAARDLLVHGVSSIEDRIALLQSALYFAKNASEYMRLVDFIPNLADAGYRKALEEFIFGTVTHFLLDAPSRMKVWQELIMRPEHSIEFKKHVSEVISKRARDSAESNSFRILEVKYFGTKLSRTIASVTRSCGYFFKWMIGAK